METKKLVDSAIRVPCSLEGDFFEKWFQILKPIHKLSNTEIKLVALFCKYRYKLSKSITDEKLLDEYLFSVEVKALIRKDCEMSTSSFQVSMCKLKKAGVIVDNKINPKLIPHITNTDNNKLLIYFDLNG